MPLIELGTIVEGNTASVDFTFKDSAQALITSLDTCTFTYDKNDEPQTIINSRNAQDALVQADFSFSAGVLTWQVKEPDGVVNISGNLITIIATFDNGGGANSGKLKESFILKVSDLKRVTI